MDAKTYRDALDAALGLKDGDRVAVNVRQFAMLPSPPHGLPSRSWTPAYFVKWEGDCIVYRTLIGAVVVDPIDDVYISIPPEDEFNNAVREVAASKGGRRIELPKPGMGL